MKRSEDTRNFDFEDTFEGGLEVAMPHIGFGLVVHIERNVSLVSSRIMKILRAESEVNFLGKINNWTRGTMH